MVAGVRLTQEDFTERIKELVGEDYTVKSEYKNTGTKVKMTHNTCGRDMDVTPRAFYKGSRCKYCVSGVSTKDTEWMKYKMYELVGDEYELKGEYTRSKDKTKVKHTECGYVWEVTPDNFIRRRSRCPKCSGNARTDTKGFKERLAKMFSGEYTTEDKYINARTKMSITHTECGNDWMIAPDTLLNNGVGCPTCKESRGERLIRTYLEEIGENYIRQKTFEGCVNKKELPFDFYLPKYNMCIEYDGIQHYEPVRFGGRDITKAKESYEKVKRNDKTKTRFCESKGIHLLRVPYYHTEIEVKDAIKTHITMRSNVESPTPKRRIMI